MSKEFKEPILRIKREIELLDIEITPKGLKVREVHTNEKDGKNVLRKYGFGEEVENEIFLTPEEVVFFAAISALSISGESKDVSNAIEAISSFSDSNIWARFAVYWRLREHGYIVKKGFGDGIDFRVYDAFPDWSSKGAKYLVSVIREGLPTSFKELAKMTDVAKNMKKELVLALVSSQGEITFYKVSRTDLRFESEVPSLEPIPEQVF